jgi:hypothetical protein
MIHVKARERCEGIYNLVGLVLKIGRSLQIGFFLLVETLQEQMLRHHSHSGVGEVPSALERIEREL